MRWLGLLACSLTALAQTPVFTADTTLQSIPVQVTDKRGNPVKGLRASDFTLLEDGEPQEISFFGAEKQPTTLAVLIDASSSMRTDGKLDRARALLGPLLRGANPRDEIFLVPFTDHILPLGDEEPFTQFTPGQRLFPPEIKIPAEGHGGTSIYDSLASALCHLRTAQNARQAVVVVTDGGDQHSRLNLNQLIQLTRSSNAQIFLVGFFGKSEYRNYRESPELMTLIGEREVDNPLVVFESLAKESGAESFFPTSESDLQKALTRISDILDAQYTLAYYPRDAGHFRRIDVKVKNRELRVVTRHGVGAEAGDEGVHFLASACEVSPKDHPYPWELRVTRNASGLLKYHEDFSDPRTGWPNHVDNTQMHSSAGLRYLAGEYEIYDYSRMLRGTRFYEGILGAYGPMWDDFRASVVVEARLDQSRGGTFTMAPGLIFHMNPAGYYALLVSGYRNDLKRDNHDIAVELVRRTWRLQPETVVIPWTKADSTTTPLFKKAGNDERKRKLSVEYIQGRIRVLVNEREVAAVEDDEYATGYIGLALFGTGSALFRDLVVENLP